MIITKGHTVSSAHYLVALSTHMYGFEAFEIFIVYNNPCIMLTYGGSSPGNGGDNHKSEALGFSSVNGHIVRVGIV